MKTYLTFFLYLLLAFSQVGVCADSPDPKTSPSPEFKSLAEQLRCPTCQSLSVLDSDAPFSEQIKSKLREQLSSGRSQDEILSYFVERYGPWILREPPKEGLSLLAWILPAFLLLVIPLFPYLLGKKQKSEVAASVKTRDRYIEEFYRLVRQKESES